ncbi:MAG: porphobilinogen synthase [Pseudomonadota bacterium]
MSQISHAPFPMTRPRRLRTAPWIRNLNQEHWISVNDLIWPIFICAGEKVEEPIPSMPGVSRLSIDLAVQAAEKAANLGIPCLALFPNTPDELRTEDAEEAWNSDNLANTATRAIKAAVPDIGVMLDVALDPYSASGHDGVMVGDEIVNDLSLMALEKQALSQAEAGCDILGPSDMMDGRIGVIRQALEAHDYPNVAIMSYAAKYASAFYGPFRDAVGASATLRGDKKTYQMNPGNGDEALKEVAIDLSEGADMVMVKPGMPYLDVCRQVKDTFKVPTFAYQVSGEYAMIAAACDQDWLQRDVVVEEALLAFKRAGCDGILTYFALEMAERLHARSE